MERMWKSILEFFGQDVTLRSREGEVSFRAIVQPVLDRGADQEAHSPLGLERKDQYRYIGPAQYPLDLNTVVECKGRDYRVRSCHLTGEGVCPHWWASLYPRDGVEV